MTDFAEHLTKFFSEYLPAQRNAGKNTIASYRDAFKLLLAFCQEEKGIAAEKLAMVHLDKELLIGFLDWLENSRNCGISTKNQRLGAIHSFFKFVQYEEPEGLYYYGKVLEIPVKKTPKPRIPYLSADVMRSLLAQPDRSVPHGRRDALLLSLLYDSGCRVQELIDLNIGSFIEGPPAVLVIMGKGRKIRRVPLMQNTVNLLLSYRVENKLNKPWLSERPLFVNKQFNRLTKEGVAYIINKYLPEARRQNPLVPERVSPHMFRHAKAVHLLQANVNLVYIRDFLGHADIRTTEIYAKADTEMKRKALVSAYPSLINDSLPAWQDNPSLMDWLKNLS